MTDIKQNEFISLGDVSKDIKIGIAKSKLAYYTKLGLLRPVSRIGKMFIFDTKDIYKRLDIIKNMQSKGYSLKKIEETLNK